VVYVEREHYFETENADLNLHLAAHSLIALV